MRSSPHEEYREPKGKLPLAQLHRPNSGMSNDVAVQETLDVVGLHYESLSLSRPPQLHCRTSISKHLCLILSQGVRGPQAITCRIFPRAELP